MKILTVSNYYPPYFIGGYEIACKETMDFLKNTGHHIEVLTSNYEGTIYGEEGVERTMTLTNYATASRLSKMQDENHNHRLLKEAIERFKPDLVYFWSLRGIGLGIIEAANNANIPKVFEIGDFWMKGYMHQKEPSTLKRALKTLIPFSHTQPVEIRPTICVSQWIADELVQEYKIVDNYVIPNGTTIPEQLGDVEVEHLRFIFAGRIDEEKGLDLAIKALISFNEKHPQKEFSLEVFGKGDEAFITMCKELASPIHNKVHFHGMVSDRAEIYKNGSIFLMPTRMREPFGLVVIEAMAYGCVVIATDAYGPAEIIDDEQNGLLFKPEDIDDFCRQIEQVATNESYKEQLRVAGFEHVKTNYDVHVVKPKVEAILHKIAGV